MLNKLLIVCCLLAMVSCSAKRKLVAGPNSSAAVPAKPVNDVESRLAPIRSQQVSFNSFTARAKASLTIDNDSHDCTLNIRINRDKEIWVSITYLIGIEVARAEITPDSIQVINRLQGVYMKKPFSFIYTYTNRQIDFTMLQALLVGNAVPQMLNDSTNYTAANNNITLSGNLQDLVYKLVLGNDLKVTQTNLSNQSAGQSLQISNNAFIQSGTQKVPSQIDIASVAKDKKIQVNLHYVKVDFNQPQDYPFNIPGSYNQVN